MYCSSKVVPEFSCKANFCAPPPPNSAGGRGRLNEIAGIEGGDFFQGLLQFLHKKCLKSEIFNDKKSL